MHLPRQPPNPNKTAPQSRLFPPEIPAPNTRHSEAPTTVKAHECPQGKTISSNRGPLPRPMRQRTFFGVALQLARAFPLVIGLVQATAAGESSRCHSLSLAIADAILDGARPRDLRRFSATVVDAQARSSPLSRHRPSRPGRTPQAIARRR